MVQHLLHIIDMQADFVNPGGKFMVPWSNTMSERMDDFFSFIPQRLFDMTLFTYTTHFVPEYQANPESKITPELHCDYNTAGWAPTLNTALLKGKTQMWHMGKNTIDLWRKNPVLLPPKLKPDEMRIYDNLFHVTDDPKITQRGVARDEFLKSIGLGTKDSLNITVMGVASDFAIHDAVMGYLNHGAKVRIVEDLVTGRGTSTQGRAYSGHIRDVLALPVFSSYVKNNQVTLISSSQVAEPFAAVHY